MVTLISMFGFLVLIVVGFLALVFRNKPSATNIVQYEMMARFVTMSFIALEYGINPTDLKDLNNLQAMEERAKRIKAERELSALKNHLEREYAQPEEQKEKG